ncbi:MAG: hypothetical protein IJZ81_04225 [Clostridia bacterium]|nr:hypothetical protein [Clostridia bacterium]
MQKTIKKLFCGVLVASFISGATATVSAHRVGDTVGKVLSTDIVTYIDSIRVPSFNIAGRTAIIAENLNAMGLTFGVSFDEATRTLSITDKDVFGTGGRDFFHFDKDTSSKPVGTPIMNVLYTDITANFNGNSLESFNIGGYTCIYADDLAELCGTYVWDEEARTVNVKRGTFKTKPSIKVKEAFRALFAKESSITKSETFDRWGKAATSHLVKNADGTFSAVEIDEHINIETYDADFNHLSSFAIKKELPLFGGLYFGKDFNYIAFGQENLLCDNSREVIRIVIYDKSFVKISEVSISNCKTAIPFDASSGEMYEDERYLVLHTSRTQYPDENGNRPQTQLTVIVDKSNWSVCNMLGKFQYNHTSHALREFVRLDEGRLITANYSDAAPIRGAFLQELDFSGKIIHAQGIFNVGGPLAANCTGAMIGGLEVSPAGYLVSMSSIDHSLPTGYNSIDIEGIDRENRDIYLLWADKNTWQLRHTCLARYTGAALTGSVPYLVKLKDSNFMVLWQQFSDYSEDSDTLCYAFVNANGEQIGQTYSLKGRLSESCKPIESDGKVIWYVNTDSGREFYSLSSSFSDYEATEDEVLGNSAPIKPEDTYGETQKETNEEIPLPRDEDDDEKTTEVDGI